MIPVGRYFGIKDAKKHNVVENPILEAAYRRSKSPDSNALMVSQLLWTHQRGDHNSISVLSLDSNLRIFKAEDFSFFMNLT